MPLLVKNVGGTSGGGSQLTALALTLMEEYRRFHRDVAACVDEHFAEGMGRRLERGLRRKPAAASP